MTYADELRAELERQVEFRRLPPSLMTMIESYAEARYTDGYKRACADVSNLLVAQEKERAKIEATRREHA